MDMEWMLIVLIWFVYSGLASLIARKLRRSINNLREADSHGMVAQRIFQLVQRVKEIEIEVNVQGEDGEEYSNLSPVVYECLRGEKQPGLTKRLHFFC